MALPDDDDDTPPHNRRRSDDEGPPTLGRVVYMLERLQRHTDMNTRSLTGITERMIRLEERRDEHTGKIDLLETDVKVLNRDAATNQGRRLGVAMIGTILGVAAGVIAAILVEVLHGH